MQTRVGALAPHSWQAVVATFKASLFVSARCGHSFSLIADIF
jgi:hypothetical protein